jgi:Ribonuclease HI
MHLLVHTDGAAKGNPGPSGIGIALYKDGESEPLATIAEYIGDATNNVAEYRALIRGLSEALMRGADSVSVRTDSELMVRQLEGRYKVSAPQIAVLHGEAKRLLAKFGRVDLRHVPRSQNALADKLANQGVAAGRQQKPEPLAKKPAPKKETTVTAAPAAPAPAPTIAAPKVAEFPHTYSTQVGDEEHIWDVERLWRLAAPLTPTMVPLESVAAILDLDCWFGGTPATIRRVAEHAKRIYEADLSKPILLDAEGGVMDGGHRIARAYLEGRAEILAVRFPETPEPNRKRRA